MLELNLSDRMKRYELVNKRYLSIRTPVIARVNGRAFHSLTCGFDRPFDQNIIQAMKFAALKTAEQMQGFKACYIQSDKASFLLTDYDELHTQSWFGYELNKVVSISASAMTVYFNYWMDNFYWSRDDFTKDDFTKESLGHKRAMFDSRAFNLPREEVTNYFVSRAKDWSRNSIQMFARSIFSYSELRGKKIPDMHEMLHVKGKNWTTDLTDREKNGTFLVLLNGKIEEMCNILPNFDSINQILGTFVEEPRGDKEKANEEK